MIQFIVVFFKVFFISENLHGQYVVFLQQKSEFQRGDLFTNAKKLNFRADAAQRYL